jgi:hypothetical protein
MLLHVNYVETAGTSEQDISFVSSKLLMYVQFKYLYVCIVCCWVSVWKSGPKETVPLATDGSIKWLSAINNTASNMDKGDCLSDGKLDFVMDPILMFK